MITQILSRSNVAEVSTTTSSILKAVKAYSIETNNYLTGLISNLGVKNDNLTEAINQQVELSDMPDKNKKSDNAVRAIFFEVKSKAHWPNEDICKAAENILVVLNNYGLGITQMSFAAQSAHINALIKDLESPELADDIATLPGLQLLIDNLINAQKNFEEGYQERINQQVERKSSPSASQISEQIKEQINNDIMPHLYNHSKENPDNYLEINQKVETIIQENNRKVKIRINKNGKDSLTNAN